MCQFQPPTNPQFNYVEQIFDLPVNLSKQILLKQGNSYLNMCGLVITKGHFFLILIFFNSEYTEFLNARRRGRMYAQSFLESAQNLCF